MVGYGGRGDGVNSVKFELLLLMETTESGHKHLRWSTEEQCVAQVRNLFKSAVPGEEIKIYQPAN